MRSLQLLRSARSLRAGAALVRTPRRPASSGSPQLEELFSSGGAMRSFLERLTGPGVQAHSGAKKPELAMAAKKLREKEQELQETERLLEDENEDLRKLAENEIISCQKELTKLKQKIILLLIPSEETDENDLILELTAGVGGGLRHASASIGGPEAYRHMKFEGGVHRVQRVPKTEKQGRMHTSTMTVAILPQPTEINLVINPKELRIETKRASGAGGQHVNTTDSAVRIVHLPTGVATECQQERSQIKNKEMAMKKLRAKLYNMQLEEETNKRYSARKIQIGTKGRSEKIRTYHFPQNRVTDHRISKSLYDIQSFMLGEYLLDELVQSLKEYADYESITEVISEKH
ncbi:peptide chain release factor 1-like, mitochondrial isoform X2 [Gracilinanus agilis]|uniref:peptide chain release factor 1-like, mitochondrial isoform X2 n=1 Tax=Gracilinanus agilis TaxID=191870 RepID=UPI001CFDA248|nr:peptide chain release factor 1-like, mitochondrial isoform X2 [Gracilinanus agilis]